MPQIKIFNEINLVETKFITFSDGAISFEIVDFEKLQETNQRVLVQLDVKDCTKDIFALALVKDALDRLGVKDVRLSLMYIPFARADRVFCEGGSHALKVFCNILNTLNFSKVFVADPHSDVSTALINNAEVMHQKDCFLSVLPNIEKITKDFVLCAPDFGATKKIRDVAVAVNKLDFIQGTKIRDVSTGQIVACDVLCDDLQGKDVVIVDDICDGGASFIHLADKLKEKNCGKIILFTTHGIYAKTFEVFKDKIDGIFCYNLVADYLNRAHLEDSIINTTLKEKCNDN